MFNGLFATRRIFYVFLTTTLLILIATLLPACGGPPEATVKVDVISGEAPLQVTFSNKSKNADQFQWDFGDGTDIMTNKEDKSVDHEYTKAGTHTVVLTAFKKEEPTITSTFTLPITVNPGPLDRVIIKLENIKIQAGQTQQLVADAVDVFGNIIPKAELVWEVVPEAGTITRNGLFTAGTKADSYDDGIIVTAQVNSNSVKATGILIIEHGPIDHVMLNPEAVQLVVGQRQQFTAVALDAYDNPTPAAKLTWEVAGEVGTITNDGQLTASTKAGHFSNGVTVTAIIDSDSVKSTAPVDLTPGTISRVRLIPETVGLQRGQSQLFIAQVLDSYGNRISAAQLTWEVTSGDGTITSNGLFTAGTQMGKFDPAILVTAKSNGHSVSATATVTIEWLMTYLGMNTKILPYSDKRIRQAVSYCIDDDELIVWAQNTYSNNAQKVLSIVSPADYKGNISPYRDIERARQLMAEAGYPNGFLATPLYVSSGMEKLAGKIADYLADADINTEIISVSDTDLSKLPNKHTSLGDWGYLFLTETSVDWDDTTELLGRLLLINGEENYTGFSNSTFDSDFKSGSFSKAEDLYFNSFKAIVPLFWSMPGENAQTLTIPEMLLQLGTPQVNDFTVTIGGVTETWATKVEWDWGDGTRSESFFPATHIYNKNGTYTVTVTTHGPSSASAVATTTVIVDADSTPLLKPGTPPELNFDSVIDGLKVTMNGGTRPMTQGTTITRIHWDWGDGSSENAWFPASHTYGKSGSYTVKVTSHQSDGLSTSKTVTIVVSD